MNRNKCSFPVMLLGRNSKHGGQQKEELGQTAFLNCRLCFFLHKSWFRCIRIKSKMAEGVSASMPIVLRMVGDAIGLDSQNRKKEAYCQYLSCCIYISQILKDDAWDKDLQTVYNKDAAKLFKLIQQCQERALNIISSESMHPLDSPPGSPLNNQHSQPSQTLSPQPGNLRKYSDTVPCPARPGQSREQSQSDSLNSGSPSTMPYYRGKPLKLPSPPSSPHVTRSGQDISNSYKSTTDKRVTGINMRVSRPCATDKNLSTMRRMTENLLIAKAREEAIKKKVWERQQRLQIEANRRFASAVAVSKDEQEQRLLYTKILEYEQDMVWPQKLREQLKRSPEDTALINKIINKIFSSKDHPLRQFLLQYQYYVYNKLLPLLKDINFPDEKQLKESNNGVTSKTVKKAEIEQVDGRTEECERKVSKDENSGNASNTIPKADVEQVDGNTKECERKFSEDENDSKDEMDEENVVENDGLESGQSSSTECLELDAEENKRKNDDNTNDNNVDTVINSTKEAISNNSDNDKDILEKRLQENEVKKNEFSNTNDKIHENQNLGNRDNELQEIDNDNDVGEFKNKETSKELCKDIKIIESGVNDESENENIYSIVREILEDILAQVVEYELVEHVDNLGLRRDTSIFSGSKESQLDLKPTDQEPAIDVVAKDSHENLNRTCTDKKANLFKIESFDLESEFRSLEEDMFDSESSEDEAEHDEENNIEARSDNDFNQDILSISGVETKIPEEIPSDTLEEDSERIVEPEGNKNQEYNDKSGEKDSNVAAMEPDLKKDVVISNAEREGLSAMSGSDEKKESSESEVSPMDLESARKQLNEIFVDMRFFLEKLKGFIILAYEELATPTGHDQCYAAVEHPFFQPLWPLLLGVLRRVNFEKEISLGSVMTKRIHNTPADMGVIDRLCLSHKETLEATGNVYPYQLAIEQLHKVTTCYCPLEKLECIVRASRGICQCVEDYWECKGKPRHCSETSIGCDDLLPILCYVIVKSGIGQLISESSAMEEFIPEGYLMGEEGYCLTTLQTALAYLITLDCS